MLNIFFFQIQSFKVILLLDFTAPLPPNLVYDILAGLGAIIFHITVAHSSERHIPSNFTIAQRNLRAIIGPRFNITTQISFQVFVIFPTCCSAYINRCSRDTITPLTGSIAIFVAIGRQQEENSCILGIVNHCCILYNYFIGVVRVPKDVIIAIPMF